MNQFSDTITLNEIFDKYAQGEIASDQLPEFTPFFSLAQTIKQKGCKCGMHQAIAQAQIFFNHMVLTLSEENITRMKSIFGKEKLCFGIQTREKFETKCY